MVWHVEHIPYNTHSYPNICALLVFSNILQLITLLQIPKMFLETVRVATLMV